MFLNIGQVPFLHFYTQRQNMFLIEQALLLTDNYSYINIAERKVFFLW